MEEKQRGRRKKKIRGEVIWKPDLDMDTWSDPEQTKLAERGSGCIPDQIPPTNKDEHLTNPNWTKD